MARRVAVVPHTHWDREWYDPYQRLRHRLVAMVDQLLDELEAEPRLTWFLLDGQMAVVDDYLEARPAARPRLAALAGDGRVSLGPWYILMDEFCVSAETIVRNLQLGMARAADLGGAMAVGYLPDMFGHVAQMPQILRQAGLDHAVVWRGVPAAVDRTGFWWEAPDGSRVRAEYLPVGYGIGAHLPDRPEDLLRRLRAEEGELARFLTPDDAILLMNGTDHQLPQVRVPGLLAELAGLPGAADEFDAALVPLPEYLAGAPTTGLPTVRGELRSSARANLLAGVLSNRVDVKAAAARTERLLERTAEPLATLWLDPDRWPGQDLDASWLRVIHNSAHDSICACSADEVGRAVLVRFDEAATLAGAIADDALAAAALAVPTDGPVVVNPSPRPRRGVVEVVVPGEGAPAGTQAVGVRPAARVERTGTGADLYRILGALRAEGWLGDGWGSELTVDAGADGVVVRITDDDAARRAPDVQATTCEAFVSCGAHRGAPLRVVVDQPASTRVATLAEVDGWGWAPVVPGAVTAAAVEASGTTMANDCVAVTVDPDTATFSLVTPGGGSVSGLGRLVDGGDVGDTYTWSPPALDTIVDKPERVTVAVAEAGPVRARLVVTATYRWPERVEDGARTGGREATVVTELELRAGEALLRVVTSLDNPARDHRLRALLPLPSTAEGSRAECAFGTVERGLEAEGGPDEVGLPTFPSRRFVTAGGLTVSHEGLLEYEVVDGGRALALTLLRATGYLSRPAPVNRPNPAGPTHPVEGPQMIGPVTCRYALSLGADDPYAVADLAWTELAVVDGTGAGALEEHGSRLTVTGAEVSALHRVDGEVELRVFNPSERPATVAVPGRSGRLVDLTGRDLGAWAGGFDLGPWAVATARLA